MKLLGLVILIVILQGASAKVYGKCGVAQALSKCGMEKDLLPDYVCLVFSESSGNTSAIGGPNSNGSFDWGLFQINDKYWCTIGQPGKDCNIDCNALVNDDIRDDCACARKIYKRHKFSAWNGWKKRCQNKPLPDISDCGL